MKLHSLFAAALISVGALLLPPTLSAQSRVHWSGAAAPDARWSTKENWNSHVPFAGVATDTTVVFDYYSADAGRRAPVLDANASAAGLFFHGGGFELSSTGGARLSLPLTGTTAGTAPILSIFGANVIDHPVDFTSGVANARAVSVDSGTLTFGPNSVLNLNGAAGGAGAVAATYVHVSAGAQLITDGAITANAIVDRSAFTRLVKEGGGDWIIRSAGNSLSSFGDLRVGGGRVVLNASNALGSLTITNNPSATDDRSVIVDAAGVTVSNVINFTNGAATTSASVGGTNSTGTATFTGRVSLSSAGTNAGYALTKFVAATGGVVVFKGVIADNGTGLNRQGGVDKIGGGTVIFEAANTYTLGTRVSAGVLRLNNTTGSGAGTGNLVIAHGATLGGRGAMTGTVTTLGPDSRIAPGGGPGYTGTVLTVGALNATEGATFFCGPEGARLNVSGVFNGGAPLVFDFSAATVAPASGTRWILVSFGSAQNLALSQMSYRGLPAGRTGGFVLTGQGIDFNID